MTGHGGIRALGDTTDGNPLGRVLQPEGCHQFCHLMAAKSRISSFVGKAPGAGQFGGVALELHFQALPIILNPLLICHKTLSRDREVRPYEETQFFGLNMLRIIVRSREIFYAHTQVALQD